MDDPKQVGVIGGSEKRDITIVDYDPAWAEKFQRHAEIIRKTLGGIALQVEHIGSTSVPGLAAKPIIDILVVVPDSANEDTYLTQLESAGYILRVREPDFHEHRMMRTPEKDVHIHIYSPNSLEVERYLLFRNQLRSNRDALKRYESVKRELAQNDWSDMNAYAEAKTKVVEEIIASARMNRQRVAAVIIVDKKILLVRDAQADFFSAPGGSVEPGEDHQQALVREVSEEVGATILDSKQYHSIDLVNQIYNVPQTDHNYLVSINGEPVPSAEIVALGWFSKEDIESHKVKVPNAFYETLFPKLVADGLL